MGYKDDYDIALAVILYLLGWGVLGVVVFILYVTGMI